MPFVRGFAPFSCIQPHPASHKYLTTGYTSAQVSALPLPPALPHLPTALTLYRRHSQCRYNQSRKLKTLSPARSDVSHHLVAHRAISTHLDQSLVSPALMVVAVDFEPDSPGVECHSCFSLVFREAKLPWRLLRCYCLVCRSIYGVMSNVI